MDTQASNVSAAVGQLLKSVFRRTWFLRTWHSSAARASLGRMLEGRCVLLFLFTCSLPCRKQRSAFGPNCSDRDQRVHAPPRRPLGNAPPVAHALIPGWTQSCSFHMHLLLLSVCSAPTTRQDASPAPEAHWSPPVSLSARAPELQRVACASRLRHLTCKGRMCAHYRCLTPAQGLTPVL